MDFEKENQELDILVVLEDFLREARRLLLLGIVLVLLCGAGLTVRERMTYRPTYQATASFTVKAADPLYASVSTYNMKTAEQMAKTFPYILTSGVLQNRVKAELGISVMPNVSVSVMPNSSVITLTVRHSDARLAYDTLNAVIRFYPEIAEFVVGSTVLSLLDESGLPTRPINAPNLKSTLIKGCILGGFLWCVIVLVFALSKTTIHNEDMLRKLLNLDCYGQVPTVKVAAKDSCPLLHKGRKKPEFSEAIRSVRMHVERAMESEDKKVLLVSSAIPGEGKTTISLNLGIALARRGKKVLIIDCDLRNPSVAKGLNLDSKLSLPDYLSGKANIREVTCPSGTENLSVITGGPGGAKYSQLMTRERGELLVLAARKLYDYVILDTPPCSMLADAGEVAALADAGLLVVRQDYASRGQILDGVQRLGDGDLSLIGWVFNHTRRSLSYSYSYNHAYNYGGGYAYDKKSR